MCKLVLQKSLQLPSELAATAEHRTGWFPVVDVCRDKTYIILRNQLFVHTYGNNNPLYLSLLTFLLHKVAAIDYK